MADPKRGPDPRPLYTPEFAAKRRRNAFWSLILGMALGVFGLAEAFYARGHGGMVSGGSNNGYLQYPWWIVAPIGAFVLALSVWGMWVHLTRPD